MQVPIISSIKFITITVQLAVPIAVVGRLVKNIHGGLVVTNGHTEPSANTNQSPTSNVDLIVFTLYQSGLKCVPR